MPPSQWMSTNRRLPGIDNRLHRIRKQAFGHRPRGNSRHEAVHATEFGSRNSATGQNSAAAIGQGAHDGQGLSVDAAAQRHRGRMMRAKKSKQAIHRAVHSSPQRSTAVQQSQTTGGVLCWCSIVFSLCWAGHATAHSGDNKIRFTVASTMARVAAVGATTNNPPSPAKYDQPGAATGNCGKSSMEGVMRTSAIHTSAIGKLVRGFSLESILTPNLTGIGNVFSQRWDLELFFHQ